MEVFKMGIGSSFVSGCSLRLTHFLFLFLLIGILSACSGNSSSDLPPSAPDTTPPTVSFNPTPGQNDVFITSVITLQFSEPVLELVPGNFGICEVAAGSTACNKSISFVLEVNGANNIVTLKPADNLGKVSTFVGDKEYKIKVNVSGTIVDTSPAKNPLEDGKEVSALFTTSSRPSVTATLPGNPGPRSIISATFSEAMKPATITGTSFTVNDDSGMAVTGTVSLSGDGLTASFLPAVDLVTGTTYTATMSAGATDLADNALVEHIWNITLQAPTAVIHFPTPVSLTDAATLTVTGAASDEGNIMGVSVNGVPATSTDGFATWRVQADIAPGENKLAVRTEDNVGNVNLMAAEATVQNSGPVLEGPLGITLDVVNNRALITDNILQALVVIDLNTGNRTIISDANNGSGLDFSFPYGVTLDTLNKRALIIDNSLDALVAVDLATGDRTVISNASRGSGQAFFSPTRVTLDVDNNHNRVLVIDSGLLAVDLTTGDRTVISNASRGSGPGFINPLGVTLDTNYNRILVTDGRMRALVAVDPTTGNRTIISNASTGSGPAFFFPIDVALDANNNRVLIIDSSLDALLSVDLATGNRTIISNASTGSGKIFDNPTGVILDTNNNRNRALIIDNSLDSLVAVDLTTGNRTIVSDTRTGSGPAFSYLSAVSLDTINDRTFVIDWGVRALVAVDLATGDRTIVSDAGKGSGPAFMKPTDVTMDAANARALVIDYGLQALVTVDIATGNRIIISDASTGNGPTFRFPYGVTLDAANNRTLVIDSNLDALVAVDLTTGNRTIISDASTGSGPAFVDPNSATLDAANNRALVIDWSLAALVAVDLATGDRTIISDASTGGGPIFSSLNAVTLDTANNRALVIDAGLGALIAVDLATGDRTIVSDAGTGNGPAFSLPQGITLDVVNNRAMVIDRSLDALMAVELVSGDRVIVSK